VRAPAARCDNTKIIRRVSRASLTNPDGAPVAKAQRCRCRDSAVQTRIQSSCVRANTPPRKCPSDLEGPETVHRPDVGARGEVHAAADLKQEQRNQRRLQKHLTIEVAHRLHRRTIGVRPKDQMKVIGEVRHRKMAMMPSADIPWAMRSGAGAASAVARASLRQNAVSAVISSPTDGWPAVREDQASPSMVQRHPPQTSPRCRPGRH